jgi:hypothetical protein
LRRPVLRIKLALGSLALVALDFFAESPRVLDQAAALVGVHELLPVSRR